MKITDSTNYVSQEDVQKVRRFVKKIIHKNKQADLFQKTFLKPIEIALKTY